MAVPPRAHPWGKHQKRPRSVLNEAQVKCIKQLFVTGVGDAVLAAQYGVSPNTIRNIRLGISWTEVEA